MQLHNYTHLNNTRMCIYNVNASNSILNYTLINHVTTCVYNNANPYTCT